MSSSALPARPDTSVLEGRGAALQIKMKPLDTPQASGIQIAFFIFAIALLAVPLASWLTTAASWPRANESLVGRFVMLLSALAIIVSIPGIRGTCARLLRVPIARTYRAEVAAVAVVAIIGNFAAAGGIALWLWMYGGNELLAAEPAPGAQARLAAALSAAGLLVLPLAWLIGPIVEEIVFRGLLYRAWLRRWHWIVAMILTSIVFGLYHPIPIAAFCSSILLVCVYRRTGSLRAAIAVHATANISLWYPLFGQFVFPAAIEADLWAWRFHLACLAFIAAFLPVYAWLARDTRPGVGTRGPGTAAEPG